MALSARESDSQRRWTEPLLLKDLFYWGVSCVHLGPFAKLRQTVFTASARILLPSVAVLGIAGVGDC